MKSILISLALIMTSTVEAQAMFSPADLGMNRIDTKRWIATHAGMTELDGLEVVAAVEALDGQIKVPALVTGVDVRLPTVPVQSKSYRITLVAQKDHDLQAQFSLVGRTVYVDGASRFALVTSTQSNYEFQFLVLPKKDGSLEVRFTRDLGEGNTQEGSFILKEVPRIL
jgi:hypothetical protein